MVAPNAAAAVADTAVTAAGQVDLATVLRDRVRKMALSDPLPEVRAEAWNAVLSTRGDEAIREFVTGGYAAAKTRAADRIKRDRDYIGLVNRYSLPDSAVRVTSGRALVSTENAQAEYVRTGHAKAQELDRVNGNRYEERLARLGQADRDYVADLAAHDPGTQVRAAAQRALSGDDTSIGLFFKYYWGIAADLDDEAFRRNTTDQNEIWHSRIALLIEAASAAERAERESSGEFARKARAEAIAAWQQVEQQAGQSATDWTAEKARADAQAAAWAAVVAHARGAQTEQDWAAVLARAEQGNTSWADEAAWALGQASTWQNIAAQARANALAALERDRGDR
ncbi:MULTISPECIES: hypothetical protein [Saccharothrix]|uniref:hypothetical protein n=1 Tax=Saccharothrix TaxID=2071 RepID=UPI00093C6E16|nr:hypothetical protein [Saccharothrix sp. CB00851]OKI36414.1 hypothetical protein A6A25_21980 [Saccharothrix sp. CB00851]